MPGTGRALAHSGLNSLTTFDIEPGNVNRKVGTWSLPRQQA
jgi:hypothetical protein